MRSTIMSLSKCLRVIAIATLVLALGMHGLGPGQFVVLPRGIPYAFEDDDMAFAHVPFERDVVEVVGALMFVLGGSELSLSDVEGLTFAATGELEAALNEAFIKLLEFTHDANPRASDSSLDHEMRMDLQRSLEKIAYLADPSIKIMRDGSGGLRFESQERRRFAVAQGLERIPA